MYIGFIWWMCDFIMTRGHCRASAHLQAWSSTHGELYWHLWGKPMACLWPTLDKGIMGFCLVGLVWVCFVLFVLFCFLRQSSSVPGYFENQAIDQACLKLTEIHLPLPPEFWDYSHAPKHSAQLPTFWIFKTPFWDAPLHYPGRVLIKARVHGSEVFQVQQMPLPKNSSWL